MKLCHKRLVQLMQPDGFLQFELSAEALCNSKVGHSFDICIVPLNTSRIYKVENIPLELGAILDQGQVDHLPLQIHKL